MRFVAVPLQVAAHAAGEHAGNDAVCAQGLLVHRLLANCESIEAKALDENALQVMLDGNRGSYLMDEAGVSERMLSDAKAAADAPSSSYCRSSYADLLHDATQLASILQTVHGVGKGKGSNTVAFLLDRCYDAVVALMGTWLAGAAYVGIDTKFPGRQRCTGSWNSALSAGTHQLSMHAESRMQHVLEDSHAKVIITNDAGTSLIPTSLRNVLAVVNTDDVGEWEAAAAASFTLPELEPEDLAAVWYTSGTSGKPKVSVPAAAEERRGSPLTSQRLTYAYRGC
jgi:non-ribosomal peptide synthetase component F